MITQETLKIYRVSIIEDNHYLREGYKAILEEEPDFTVLGDYESCEKAFDTKDFVDSDVVLMDIELPGMSGIDGVKCIKQQYPRMSIIMTTIHDDDQNVFDAICAGAIGYLVKMISGEDLVKAIREAFAGGSPMTPNIARKIISAFQKIPKKVADYDELTDLELTVLGHLAEGKSYAALAKIMFLSIDGVRYHLRHIYEKLHVKTRAEAVAKGLKDHLIPPIH